MRLAVPALVFLLASSPALGNDTHLGIPPEDIVLLKWVGAPPINEGPVRLLPDGTIVQDFKIPPRRILVITDLEWDVNSFPATDTTVDVFIQMTSPASVTTEAYRARVEVDGSGFGYLSDRLTSPLIVDGSVDLDASAPAPRLRLGSVGTQGLAVTVRGYLLPARPGRPDLAAPGR